MSLEDAKREHWRVWAIDGMSGDRMRLAEATWKAALEALGGTRPEEQRMVLATEKGLTPLGKCIDALHSFVKAENEWRKTKSGMPKDTFDDPLNDAYEQAMDVLCELVPQSSREPQSSGS